MQRQALLIILTIHAMGLPVCLWAQQPAAADSAASMEYLIEAEKYFLLDEYSDAEEMLIQSLQMDSENSAAHFKYAQLYAMQEDYDSALQHIDQAIDLQPTNKYYYLEGVHIALQDFKLPEAISYYELLISRIAAAYLYHEALADLYMRSGDLALALKSYQALEQKEGYSKALGLRKHDIYQQQGQHLQATKEAHRLSQTFPEDDSLHITYAQGLARDKGLSAAIDYVAPLVRAAPSRSTLSLYLGTCYLKAEKPAAAVAILSQVFANRSVPLEEKIKCISIAAPPRSWWPHIDTLYKQLLQLYPTHLPLRTAAAKFYEAIQQPTQALTHYRYSLHAGTIRIALFEKIISIECDQQQYDSARWHVQKAEYYYPEQPVLYFFKGVIAYADQAYEQAKQTLHKGIAHCEDDTLSSRLYTQLGDVYQALMDTQEADTAYETALQLNADYAHALDHYSYYLALRKEKLSYAQQLSTHLITRHPRTPQYLNTHAKVLYAQGKYKKAKQVLEEALQLDVSPTGYLLEQYGDVLYRLGDRDAAWQQWKKAQGFLDTSSLLDDKIADKKLYE